ncbi:amino acid ABC transporter substrate-binding protein [Nitratireductor mangrovi]|uniref:Amino acid ABC transporter substrate-binding protein n=1 Tax=Nitratireductor mangrovi TaxID=2599600 RepID=A0A5B8L0T8_9HYPH|nr:ABC transporter substrate-binding protein [Nitratireductor mangrovi]QDZ01322.1 amino acid ABC transporter substrate-binding protein [Nitratireductor mangrovi]
MLFEKRKAPKLAVVGAVFAATMAVASLAAAQETVHKIAITFPLTGIAASQGEVASKAVNLAVKEINESGMLGEGARMEPFFFDSQAKPDVGVRALQQAISIEDVPYALTGYSGVSLAQAPVAERNERLLVNVGGASPALSDLSPWFFNAIPLTHLQAPVLARYLAEELGEEKVALIYRDDDLGRGIQQVLAPAMEAFGGDVVAEESFLPGAHDFRLQLSRIRAANPDVVYIGGVATEVGAIIAQGTSLGLTPRWASYGAYNHKSTIELGGEAANGGVYTNPSNFGPDLEPFPAYQKMREAWEAEYGSTDDLDYVASQFYMGTRLYAELIKRLKEAGQDVTPANMRDLMDDAVFEDTVTGGMSFDEERNAITSIAIYHLKDGKFAPITVYTAGQVREINEVMHNN